MHALRDVLDKFFNPHSLRLAEPDVWAGFQVNLKMMVIAEALVLVLALGIAVVRGLPGRAAAPFRALPGPAAVLEPTMTFGPEIERIDEGDELSDVPADASAAAAGYSRPRTRS